MLTNLVSNAIKYSPAGGNIIITTQAAGENVKVSVQDPGIGIRAEELHKVFERYYRLKDVKTHEFSGMGLGLYISNKIIQLHGGRMEVNSEEGKGSVFSFIIPYNASYNYKMKK